MSSMLFKKKPERKLGLFIFAEQGGSHGAIWEPKVIIKASMSKLPPPCDALKMRSTKILSIYIVYFRMTYVKQLTIASVHIFHIKPKGRA